MSARCIKLEFALISKTKASVLFIEATGGVRAYISILFLEFVGGPFLETTQYCLVFQLKCNYYSVLFSI